MKNIAILSERGTGYGLLQRLPSANLVTSPNGADITMADGPGYDLTPLTGAILNTSQGLQGLLRDPQAWEQLKSLLNVKDQPSTHILYGLYNGKEYAEFIEISYSQRFMNGEAGSAQSFVMGAAVRVGELPEGVYNQLQLIGSFMEQIRYAGEVAFSLSLEGEIIGIQLSHNPSFLALYAELSTCTLEEMIEFLVRERDDCPVRDMLVIGNLVSKFPYPALITHSDIAADPQAEPHLWRVRHDQTEVVIVTSRGNSIEEAKGRNNRTIRNMRRFDDELQYRTDAGYRLEFVLEQERYERFVSQPRDSRGQDQ